MRVLIPCSGYGRIYRGIEIWVENISKELSRKGIDVYIACGKDVAKKGKKDKITILKFPILKRELLIYKQRPFEEISALIESASLGLSSYNFIKKLDFDVMLSCQWSDLYLSLLLRKIKKFKHIFCFQSAPRKLTKILYLPLLFQDTKVTSISNFVKEKVKKTLGIESKVIYNGVDTKLFFPSKARERDKIIFLYVGALLKKKGIYTLLKAMKDLNSKRFELWVIGSGPEEKRIKTMINSEKIKNVSLLGEIEHKKLPSFYRASDIVVVPSEYPEAFGMVAAEAMSCGKPVIASDVGGLGEIVKKSKGGVIFEPGNKGDLIEKMLILANNFKKRKKLGKNGRNFAEKELDWSKIAEKYLKLIKD
jgi:glycosyltransferase involved in cell wall biosynthesis